MPIICRNERILFQHEQIPLLNVSRKEYDVAMKLVTPEQYKDWDLEDCSLQGQLDNVRRTSDGDHNYKKFIVLILVSVC